MKVSAFVWTTALLVLTTCHVAAQQAALPDAPTIGRAKEAGGVPAVVRDAAFTDTTAPGQAKGAPTAETRLPDADLMRVLVGDTKDKTKQKEKEKEKPLPPQPPQPESDIFASAPPTGSEAPARLNPNMIGDLPGFFSLQRILLPTVQTIVTTKTVSLETGQFTQVTGITHVQTNVSILARIPLAFSGPIKIAENQSPMPQDRVFISYNYFNGIQGGALGPSTVNMRTTGDPTTVITPVPGGPPSVDLHAETFGFEKLILGGNASLGMRVPIAQLQGDGSIGRQDIGDISGIFNYAFYRNPTTGSGLAGGLMLTAPTGAPNFTNVGDIHPWLIQPFVGYRWMNDRFYVQGFTSLLTPTDPRYLTALFNDVGMGYWLYRGNPRQAIWAVIPTFEVHVGDPLNHRSPTDPITIPNFVALTAGVHIGLSGGAMLTLGTTVPVTGPQLFPIEAVAQFNLRF